MSKTDNKTEAQFVGVDIAFPTRMYKFLVPEATADKVLNEIEAQTDLFESSCIPKKDRQAQDISVYCTDYGNNISIPTVEKILEDLKHVIASWGMEFEPVEYWTARYTEGSFHPVHTHSAGLSTLANCSGVLYLTSLGSTRLYSSGKESHDNEHVVESKKGGVVLFPSSLLHCPEPFAGEGFRYIVAFNASMYDRRA